MNITPRRTIESTRHAPVATPAVQDGPRQGARLRAARAAADLSREELAGAIGCSARTIRRLEDGQRRVTPDERRRIAHACDAPEWFLEHGWRGWQRVADR